MFSITFAGAMSCRCFKQTIPDCVTSITIDAGLTADTEYFILITGTHGNRYSAEYTTSGDGSLTIQVNDFAQGLFNRFAGWFEMQIYASGTTTDCIASGTGDAVTLEMCDAEYPCIMFSFTGSDGSEVGEIPNCEAEQADFTETIITSASTSTLCEKVRACSTAQVVIITEDDFVAGSYQNNDLKGLSADTDFFFYSNDGSGVLLKVNDGYTFNSSTGTITPLTGAGNYRLQIF